MRARHSLILILTLLASGVVASAQGNQSVYTNLNGKGCKTIEEDEEAAGYMSQQCPGVAGYKLIVDSQDLRQGVTVVTPDGAKHELNLGYIGGGAFSFLGDKAEWRVKRVKGRLVPIALIMRFSVAQMQDDGNSKDIPHLTVTKITPTKICLLEPQPAGRNANLDARRIADNSADKPCYEPYGPNGP
ncbi:MAG TPA: hypothetical protein VJT74_11075 [Pyrinomonadaceae bacterium]|nr:hypothetical protein [Pyrinomonadaceae bacterium]